MSKIRTFVSSVRTGSIVYVIGGKGYLSWLSDKTYLRLAYYAVFGKKIDWERPTTFNEKLQWLKIYDRNPKYSSLVDKYEVKGHVAKVVGEEHIIPTIGVWNDTANIDFESLPEQFVLKCTHDSGSIVICKDKREIKIIKIQNKLNSYLHKSAYWYGREWPYKNVPRRIIAEQFMQSDVGGLTDYKVHCFNGEPKLILVCKDRFAPTGLTEDFYTPQWEHLDLRRPTHPNAAEPMAKPDELDQLLEFSRILSKDIPFLRVDFYIVEGHVYFSELTFFPASGFERFEPEEWDQTLGDWLKLPDTPIT